jgi:hypothetical protein
MFPRGLGGEGRDLWSFKFERCPFKESNSKDCEITFYGLIHVHLYNWCGIEWRKSRNKEDEEKYRGGEKDQGESSSWKEMSCF